jgi:hypothetical protein
MACLCVGFAMSLGLLASQADEPVPPVAEAPSPALAEIQRQRAVFGSPLAGTTFGEAASDEDFTEAYRRVATPGDGTSTPHSPAREFSPTPDPRARYVAALRDAARLVETAAADLEDADAFAEADELRERAAQLRLQVRQPTTPPAKQAPAK